MNNYPAPPKVTVLIPVYNRGHYVGAAIDSILAQTFTDFEILVVDDGSTDNSRELVGAYTDQRVRLIAQSQNLGIPATRNRGITQARGEYIALLDSDDIALPARLAHQVDFLNQNPDYAAVGAWIQWMDESGKKLRKIKRKPVSAEQIAAERLFRQGLENSTVMARRSILTLYPHNENMALGSDYDLWARIAAEHRLTTLPGVLVLRRHHPQRVTNSDEDRSKAWRLEVFAQQLQKLGINFDQRDLDNHYLLRRMRKSNFKPDRSYLDWAESWLLRLLSVNQDLGNYPEPEFSAVLGEFWIKVCWYSSMNGMPLSFFRLWMSPLRHSVISRARQEVRGTRQKLLQATGAST